MTMVDFELIFETSERSDSVNHVRKILDRSTEFKFIDFEGYTVKNKKVTLLLDRAKYVLKPSSSNKYTPKDIYTYLCNKFQNTIDIKKHFAEKINVPWYFVIYGENETSIVLDMLNEGEKIHQFRNFKELAEWTKEYRQYIMKSKFEEADQLPIIDKKMREIQIPWPGNLDKALCKDNNVIALIEYQKTKKDKVRDHDNNKYFQNTYKKEIKNGQTNYSISRKGDEFRWKVLDEFSQQANLPIIVIVWSESEEVVGVKIIQEIKYTQWPSYSNPNPDNSDKGIIWGDVEYVDISQVEETIKRMLKL